MTKRAPTEAMERLGPKARELGMVMGMRVDAPEATGYVKKALGKKLPQSTSDAN